MTEPHTHNRTDVSKARSELRQIADRTLLSIKSDTPSWAYFLEDWKWDQVWQDEYERRFLLRPALPPENTLLRAAGFVEGEAGLLRAVDFVRSDGAGGG